MKSKMSLIIVFSWGFMLYAQNVSLTLTQDNIALVNETRSVSLKNGLNLVVLKDLPLMLEPTSLIFSFNNQSVKLREQYFAYDLKNTQTMLNKSIGNYIRILHPELGTVQGTLISAKEGMLVIETADGDLQILSDNAGLQFIIEKSQMQQAFATEPTVYCSMESEINSEISADMSYLTSGMTWSAEYAAIIDESEKEMTLSTRTNLSNYSGKTFRNCDLVLLAGELNRPLETRRNLTATGIQRINEMMTSSAKVDFSEGEEFEYHIYRLGRKIMLENQQQKILPLYPIQKSEISKIYNYNYQKDPTGISVIVSAKNSAENGLGYPLPKGIVRIYKKYDNHLLILGEDNIPHTPPDEKIDLKIGKAFDIIAERKILDQKKEGKNNERMKISIDFRNRKDQDIEILVTEPVISRYEYKILSSNIKIHKKEAKQVEFIVPLKANQTNILEYEILYNW